MNKRRQAKRGRTPAVEPPVVRHVVLAHPAILAEVERRGKTAEMMDVMSAAYAVGADTDLAVGRYLAGLGIWDTGAGGG
jgi:hypothetical protein